MPEEKNLEQIVEEVMAENTQALLEIQAGKGSSIDKLVNEVLRRSRVKVDPRKVRQLILSKL